MRRPVLLKNFFSHKGTETLRNFIESGSGSIHLFFIKNEKEILSVLCVSVRSTWMPGSLGGGLGGEAGAARGALIFFDTDTDLQV